MEKNINININANTTGVKSLRAELRGVMQELQQAEIGSEKFEQLNMKAAALKDRMQEVNEQVAVFATGSKYEAVSNSLGEIGAGLRDMDFDRVTQGAKLFGKTAGAITFKDAIGSVKQLGGAFLQIGKAILTNPLFLIAGVVTAIIVGIVKLMDKLGILKKIFQFVGDAIDAVVQSIKDFLDWIGLTDFAAEDSARKQAAAQEKIAKSYEAKTERITDSYDHEIKLATIAGENTVDMERKKQEAIIETSRAQYNALGAQMDALRASGDLTKEKADEIRKSMLDLKKNIREARQEIQYINAQEVADNKKKEDDKLKQQQEAYKKAAEARKAEAARKRQEEEKAFEEQKKRMLQEAEELNTLTASIEQNRIDREKARQDELSAMFEESNKNAEARRERDLKNYQDNLMKEIEETKAYNEARYFLADSLVKGLQGLDQLLQQAGIKTAGLQKTIALVQIATDTAKAISATIAGAAAAAAAGGPAAPFLLAGYIASGIGTILSAVASAWAALKKAPPIGGAVAGGSPSNSAPNVSQSQPNVSLFGQNNNANNLSAPKSMEKEMIVKAYVSETDITSTQKKVNKMQLAAEL